MKKSSQSIWHAGATLCIASFSLGAVSKGMAAAVQRTSQAKTTAQGRTWDSIKRLPDWSGVWVLTDESWTDVYKAVSGHDVDRLLLTPAYAANRKAHRIPGNESTCTPVGIPSSTGLPIGSEYLFTPGRVTVIFENGIVRRIDTSGQPHPSEDDLNYTFAGNSVGHWDGNTLVVDTIGIVPQAEFVIGMRGTEKMQVSERIFRKDQDTLQIDGVMTDPNVFTKPYIYTRLYKHSSVAPVEYYSCADGARDKLTEGVQTGLDLTPPPESKP